MLVAYAGEVSLLPPGERSDKRGSIIEVVNEIYSFAIFHEMGRGTSANHLE